MNWFKKMVISWVRDDWENCSTATQGSISNKVMASRDVEAISENDPILNFRVFSAVGGKVVEFRRYDRQRDRNDTTTYIITNDQDFGERISKIATMENLKQ
jgi:hypothetical protein